MRYILIITLFSLFSFASILDFKYLKEAKESYLNGDYKKAEDSYANVNSDNARFNQADALYRQKKYEEAINLYKKIDKESLEAKKLYNIGNCYAQINKIDESIKSYEDALKLEDDKDTRFNLELLKKKKEEQKKKEDKKNDKSKKDSKDNKDNDKKDSKNKSEEDTKREKKELDKKNKEKEKKKEDKKKQMNEQNQTQVPISNMEERKWQKMLNQRGVNTLMIPLNKGEKSNENKPW